MGYNPFDDKKAFSIQPTSEIKIYVLAKGTKIFFDSRAPTEEELQFCPKIYMTNET